jgi:hypothetical protein
MDLARCNARTLITKYMKVLRLATEWLLWTDAAFDAQLFGLTIDPFARSTLRIHGFVERTPTIHQDTRPSSRFIIDLDLSSLALLELLMIAGLTSGMRQEEWAAIALSAIAVGMTIEEGRVHAQSFGAKRHPIRFKDGFAVRVEWDRSHATMTNSRLINVPCIIGCISSQVGWVVTEGNDRLLIEWTKVGDIALIERLRIFGKHDIAVVWGSGSGHPRAIAPNQFLFLFRGAIGEGLVGGTLDTQLAVGVASQSTRFVVALPDVGTFIVFANPGVDVLDIEGDDFTEARDLCLQSGDRGSQQILEQATIQLTQFLAKPIAGRKGGIDIKAVVGVWIKLEMEAQFDDEQRMFDQAFFHAEQEGFKVSGQRMAVGAITRRTEGSPAVNHGPIEERKEGAVLLDKRINRHRMEAMVDWSKRRDAGIIANDSFVSVG